jgi:hypothetical protein
MHTTCSEHLILVENMDLTIIYYKLASFSEIGIFNDSFCQQVEASVDEACVTLAREVNTPEVFLTSHVTLL